MDWWRFDDRRATMRILKEYGYPQDLEVEPIKTVVQPAKARASGFEK